MALGKFQMLEFQSWKGVTKENHIGALYRNQAVASDVMIQLLAAKRGKSLENYLKQFPTKYFDTDDDYTWEVIGSSRRNIPLVEARKADGTVMTIASGTNTPAGEPFYLVFAEDWFGDGEIIVGEKNEVYPIRVLGNPRMEGSNAVYKCELMGGLSSMPTTELATGKRFSFDYTVVERSFSKGVGAVRHTSPVAMRNEWSQVRIKDEIGGSMINKKLKFGLPVVDNSGKKAIVTMWMHYLDFKIEETFSEYKSNLIMYGRSNRNKSGEYLNIGKSGEVIRQGMGLREQMEVANTMFYNSFSLKLIEDALYELSASKLDYNERTFILRTGERGAIQFHKAALDVVSGWMAIGFLGGNAANPAIISKSQSQLHTNALSAGFQFVEFRAPNGVTVKIEVDPLNIAA